MMHRDTFPAAVLTLLTGTPLAWAAGNPVSVPAKYDGRWTIEATTISGACPGTLSLEMSVAKGEASVSSSVLYSVSGEISQAGAVRGTISTAATTALVMGRVDGDEVGRGTWRTQDGSLLTCSGSWMAHRA
ncbi:heme utilization protein [Methylobacterium sp. E-065]|uniref:heme utilization protein n=1 Tax=Methylobacterium sp. E-065 TaxID=2836583 RepID=UPI001FB992AA|nr:heme utilization protein [Methylobacterium sp. E-065]MCJ2020421.1 heme utilization protein [Methylobacterium sp. E-065]